MSFSKKVGNSIDEGAEIREQKNKKSLPDAIEEALHQRSSHLFR